jgi:hypothetical protein
MKDDPFVYDTGFNRKTNRKPVEQVEIELPKKIVKRVEAASFVLSVSREGKQQFSNIARLHD